MRGRCPSRSGPGRLPFPHGHARAAASNRPARASAPAAARSRRCPTPAGRRRREGRAARNPSALRARVLARPHPLNSAGSWQGQPAGTAPLPQPRSLRTSRLSARRRALPTAARLEPAAAPVPLERGARRHSPAAAPSARGSPLSVRCSRGGEGGAGGGRRWGRAGEENAD